MTSPRQSSSSVVRVEPFCKAERCSNYTNKTYVALSFKLDFTQKLQCPELYTEIANFTNYIIDLLAIFHMQG